MPSPSHLMPHSLAQSRIDCRALIAGLLLALSGTGMAAETAPWYRVDLVVFERLDPAGEVEELWRPPQDLGYPARVVALRRPQPPPDPAPGDAAPNGEPEEAGEEQAPDLALPRPFTLLPEADSSLAGTVARLERHRGYRVLFRGSWEQPLQRRDDAEHVLIQGGERFGDHHELEGHVSLAIERFLHLRADLWLSRFAPSGSLAEPAWHQLPRPPQPITVPLADLLQEGESPEWDDWRRWGRYTALPWEGTAYIPVTTWQLQESRRMRGEELHYLDHPRLGLLVRLRPTIRPVPATGLAPAGSPLPPPPPDR